MGTYGIEVYDRGLIIEKEDKLTWLDLLTKVAQWRDAGRLKGMWVHCYNSDTLDYDTNGLTDDEEDDLDAVKDGRLAPEEAESVEVGQ